MWSYNFPIDCFSPMDIWGTAKPSTSQADLESIFGEVNADIRHLQRNNQAQNPATPQSSNASSTSNLHENGQALQSPCSLAQFKRLRDLCGAIRDISKKNADLRELVDPEGPLKEQFKQLDEAAELQNQEINNELLRQKVAELRRRLAARRLQISDVAQECADRDVRLDQLDLEIQAAEEKASLAQSAKYKIETHCGYVRELVLDRRKEMIEDLFDAFRVQVDRMDLTYKDGKRTCACVHCDYIAGIHLPRSDSMTGHSELELSAALGHVVSFMEKIFWVMDVPLLYPMTFAGSFSWVTDPKSDKKFPLYGFRTKTERANLEFAVQLLDCNIRQLRIQCGFDTPYSIGTIRMLHEFRQWIKGKWPKGPQLERPFDSIFSTASLVGRKPVDENAQANQVANSLVHALDVAQLCYEDVHRNPHRERHVTMGEEAVNVDFDSSVLSANGTMNGEPPAERSPLPEEISDDEDDEELLEPRLHYTLLQSTDVIELYKKSITSSMACHAKFLALGTHTGQVIVMDHLGNVDNLNIPPYKPHRSPIGRICIDETGSYIASCAGDARVVVHGIGTTEYNQSISLNTAARSIAFSPNYAKKDSGQRILVGERDLLMYEKGLLFTKPQVLFRGAEKDGFITALTWKKALIAFTNEQGTRIMDAVLLAKGSPATITHAPPGHDVSRLRSTRFTPQHCWLDDMTLAIGWADSVTILNITPRDQGKREGKIIYTWTVEVGICGISHILPTNGQKDAENEETPAPYEPWGEIVIFGLKPGEEEDGNLEGFNDVASVASLSVASSGAPPSAVVAILEPSNTREFDLQAEDRIGFNTKPHSLPIHFSMTGLPEFNSYFLMGPSQIVTAAPNCPDDVVQWRRDHGRIEEAWKYALQHKDEITDPTCSPAAISRQLIEELLKEGRVKYAAKLLQEICGEQKEEWEVYVSMFEKAGRSLQLAEFLPIQRPQLEPECYEEILHTALYHDLKLFRKLAQRWSPDLFRVGALTALTMQRIREGSADGERPMSAEEEQDLYQALANLYVADRKYDQALRIYFSFKDKFIFNVIRKHQLFEQVKDQLTELMVIDKDQALSLLLNNEMSVSPKEVMDRIARDPKLQLAYLRKLFERDQGDEYADLMIQLLADLDRPGLLPFLRKNKAYHTSRALDICSQKEYVDEKVYLLVKSGNRREALNVMIQQQKRLDKAIDLCREYGDDELWSLLVDEVIASKSAKNVSQLLETAGTSIEPLAIIEKIPPEMQIPKLRDLLVKVLRDYESQVVLQKCCHLATLEDVTVMFDLFYKQARSAAYYRPRTTCALCGYRIFGVDERKEDMRLFVCGHLTHSRCFDDVS
ncbi:unnamed protein product, partial [Mesorhabditis spiculigera]